MSPSGPTLSQQKGLLSPSPGDHQHILSGTISALYLQRPGPDRWGVSSRPVYMATGNIVPGARGPVWGRDAARGFSIPGAPVWDSPPYPLLLWILTISRYDPHLLTVNSQGLLWRENITGADAYVKNSLGRRSVQPRCEKRCGAHPFFVQFLNVRVWLGPGDNLCDSRKIWSGWNDTEWALDQWTNGQLALRARRSWGLLGSGTWCVGPSPLLLSRGRSRKPTE